MSSGTSVPKPRTSRSMGPRLTVSGQIVEPSTDGAAGFNRESASVTPAQSSTAAVTYRILLIFFARALDGRCISIMFAHPVKSHAACPLAGALSYCYSVVYTQVEGDKTALLDRKWEYTSHDRTWPRTLSAGTLPARLRK